MIKISNYIQRELLPPLVDEYISELIVVKGRSQLTVNEYVSDLRLFFRFIAAKRMNIPSPDELEKNFDLSYIDADFMNKITLKDVNEFLIYCNNGRDNNKTTRARKASSVRGFFKYISEKMQYIENNPIALLEVAKSDKKLPKYLTLEQSLELLRNVDGKNKIRDYCILTLFLNCGLRLSELVNLNVTD